MKITLAVLPITFSPGTVAAGMVGGNNQYFHRAEIDRMFGELSTELEWSPVSISTSG